MVHRTRKIKIKMKMPKSLGTMLATPSIPKPPEFGISDQTGEWANRWSKDYMAELNEGEREGEEEEEE